jgi:hypothetical protein
MTMAEFSRVELTEDVPAEGLSTGMIGTIVEVYTDPPAYEVEFIDDDGYTIALVALKPDQVRQVQD